jgi:hypothetical protein
MEAFLTQRRVDRERLERSDRESKLTIEAERQARNAKTARLREQRLSVEAWNLRAIGGLITTISGQEAMMGDQNRRETGATKYPVKNDADLSDDFSQDAAGNDKPKGGMGLTKPAGEVDDKTHQSDGQNPRRATPSPATEKTSGAGPAMAEHSKDAKAPKAGRLPGAYVKK